jgi:hypothetical protein
LDTRQRGFRFAGPIRLRQRNMKSPCDSVNR